MSYFDKLDRVLISNDRSKNADGYAILKLQREDLNKKWEEQDGEKHDVWEASLPSGRIVFVEYNFPGCLESKSDFTIVPNFDNEEYILKGPEESLNSITLEVVLNQPRPGKFTSYQNYRFEGNDLREILQKIMDSFRMSTLPGYSDIKRLSVQEYYDTFNESVGSGNEEVVSIYHLEHQKFIYLYSE